MMVLSGDHIFLEPLKTLKEEGYITLAAFRPDTVSDEKVPNTQVWDYWVFRHLLNNIVASINISEFYWFY